MGTSIQYRDMNIHYIYSGHLVIFDKILMTSNDVKYAHNSYTFSKSILKIETTTDVQKVFYTQKK